MMRSIAGSNARARTRRRAWDDFHARRPVVVAREALGVAQAANLRGDLRRGPGARIARVSGIDRQAMHEQLARVSRALGKLGDRGPRRLRIDVVRSDGRNPAPIIDPSRDEPRIDARRKVGRRLEIHGRTQDQARRGDGPKEVVEIGLGGARALRAGLGAEVLDDDLLDMPVTAMQVSDGEERLETLGARLADADQNAGGERDAEFSREPQRLEARLGPLVGRAVMDSARLAQARAERFQHDPLTGRDCPQARYLGTAHHSGIGVRQEAGLAQHKRAHRLKIIDGGLVSERVQRLARRAIAQLRLVAEREQSLRAAGGGSGAGDGEHLVR